MWSDSIIMNESNEQNEKKDVMICGIDISDRSSLVRECKDKAMKSVMRWNHAPYNQNYVDEFRSVIEQRESVLLISKLDDDTRGSIIRKYNVNMRKNLLLGAYDVLYEAEFDSLMTGTGYRSIDRLRDWPTHVYDGNDLNSIKNMISELEYSGTSVSEKRKKGVYPDPVMNAKISVNTFGYIGTVTMIATIKNGAGRISCPNSWGSRNYPEGEFELTSDETELLGHLISKFTRRYGWEREPDDISILDGTHWECRIESEGKRPRVYKGYGNMPFNFIQLDECMTYLLYVCDNRDRRT